MILLLLYLSTLASLSYQYKSGGDLDAILEDILVTGNSRNSSLFKRHDCYTESGELGECLPYYLCDGGVANTDGSGVIDIRMAGDEMTCSYLNECCLPPNVRNTNDPIKPDLKQRPGCGWRNPNGLGFRITGNNDNEAEFGEFPWMVAVLQQKPINQYQSMDVYIGGGSLIHPSVVLTAAHIINGTSLKVRAGEWDTQTDGELYPYQEREVAEVVIHELFNKANLNYDAALLFLKYPFDLAPNVGLICIPYPEEYLNPNAECFATGWGKDKFGRDGQYQSILKKIDLNPVEHETCEAMFRRTRLGPFFQLHPSFVCAGGDAGKDTCTGDGGSPLVCPMQFKRDRYKLVGMVSWGIECGRAGVAGAYASAAALGARGGWLDRRLLERGYDTTVYRSYVPE